MYNTLYDDEDHGLDSWRERQARYRAAQICRKVGLRISPDHLERLDIAQVRKIIAEGLGVIEAMGDELNRASAQSTRLKRRGPGA